MRSQSSAEGSAEGQTLKQKQSSPPSKDPHFKSFDIGQENTGETPSTGGPPIEQRPPAS